MNFLHKYEFFLQFLLHFCLSIISIMPDTYQKVHI